MLDEQRRQVMQTLEEIGGWVEIEEVRYHCGPLGPTELMNAAVDGLVEIRTYYSLTAAGQSALTSSPEGLSQARDPGEAFEGSAVGPGAADTRLAGAS